MRSAPLLLASCLVVCGCSDSSAPGTPAAAPAGAAAKPDGAPPADGPSAATPSAAESPTAAPAPDDGVVIDHTVKLLDGSDKSLADYRGKAVLVVNTASECGHTPQYAGLQQLYAKYADQGFEVLAFPSNDFGGQEPGSSDEIRAFVDEQYAVEFDMFDKVVIKGDDKSALYRTLTEQTPEGIRGEVEWNFTKFLVDPQGRVVRRFASEVQPTDPAVTAAIESVLPKA